MLFQFQRVGVQILLLQQLKDDKLYGRGSCDMKGFIACTLAFAPIYSKSNLDRDIHFSFTFDEETACKELLF